MLVTKENYYKRETQNEYYGFTQFKEFVPELGGCEAKSMAKLRGEWEDKEKTAFLVGKYFHALNEGKVDQFITYKPLNAQELPFEDNSFDAIFMYGAFHHFDDKEASLKECLRIIKHKGVVCIIEPNKQVID